MIYSFILRRFKPSISSFIRALPFAMAFLASCQMEPFDPANAQQQMSGKWAYSEENSSNACQMQITADGSNGLKISNFACSGLTVKVTVVDENSLNIPRQTVGGDTFEGSGVVRKYRTMTLQFTYDNGREKISIVANCSKI